MIILTDKSVVPWIILTAALLQTTSGQTIRYMLVVEKTQASLKNFFQKLQ